MPDFIITARRPVMADQQAMIVMGLPADTFAPSVDTIPADAWKITEVREVRGANVVACLAYDAGDRAEFVTGVLRAITTDFFVDTQGTAYDVRPTAPVVAAPPAAKEAAAPVPKGKGKHKAIPVHAVGDAR